MKRALFLIAGVALAGCQTYDQMTPVEKETFLSKVRADCRAFGYDAKSQLFAQCVQAEVAKHDGTINQRRAAAASRSRYCWRSFNTVFCN